MSRSITLKIGRGKGLSLKMPSFSFKKISEESFFNLFSNLQKMSIGVFFIGLLSSHLFYQNKSGVGEMLWLFSFSLIFAVLYILRRLFSKSELMPQVYMDVAMLFMSTVLAVSLFLSSTNNPNVATIWGGRGLRIFSGITVLSVWVTFYITLVSFSTKDAIHKLALLFGISPWVAITLNLITGKDYNEGILVVTAILLPVWLVLAAYKIRSKMLYFVNIILALAAIKQIDAVQIYFALTTSFFFSILIFAFIKGWSYTAIKKMFSDFDSDADLVASRKVTFGSVITKNADLIVFISSILFFVLFLLLTVINNAGLFAIFSAGAKTIFSRKDFLQIMFGSGLTLQNGSFVMQLIHTYGIIPAVVITYVVGKIIYDGLIHLRSAKNISLHLAQIVGLIGMITLGLIVDFSEILFLVFWALVTMLAMSNMLLGNKTNVDNTYVQLSWDTYSNFTQLSLKLVRLIAIIILLVIVIWGLFAMSDVAKYIS